MSSDAATCKGCGISVRLSPAEVDRILSEYFRDQPVAVVDDATYASRLSICQHCPDLTYGTTCRYCGCLVAVRAKVAMKDCPAAPPRW